jgi:hypothetical protein
MARAEEVGIARTGLTELNHELAAEKPLVECVSLSCRKGVLTLIVLSSYMDWVETRETHGRIRDRRKIQSPDTQEE